MRALKDSSLIDYFGNKLLCLSQQCRGSWRLHQIANGLLNLSQLLDQFEVSFWSNQTLLNLQRRFRNIDVGVLRTSFKVYQQALLRNLVRLMCPLEAKALMAFSSPIYIGKILLLKPDAPKIGL